MMNVIVVDDELLMRIGLQSMINWEEYGFQIIGEAANGKEALDIIRRQSPDLIITDIKMPVMDGLELIREASKMLDACQYVILSCLDDFHYAKEALRLGATDYLIKSDIKPHQLLEVLETVKKRAANQNGSLPKNNPSLPEYKESIGYLKERSFKELFSGFLGKEELLLRCEGYLSLVQGPMVLAKLRVDHFEDIRQKYVEQDERLLRYSIVNIMEEIIPRKWRKEVFALNSAEYVLIVNIPEEGESPFRAEFNKFIEKILAAMKDFLNIGFTVGISGQSDGYAELKRAYREADSALRQLFYAKECRVQYYRSGTPLYESAASNFRLSREEEQSFRGLVEAGSEDANGFLEALKQKFEREQICEQDIRKTYLRLLSLITSCFPSTPELWNEGRTPYEQLLLEERLEGMHQLILQFLAQCLEQFRSLEEGQRSYAEQTCAIIRSQYAEDLSLQTVSQQINVNPSYLSRIFKQETGENFVAFLTRVRIEKAQQYLRDRSLKVYEIADKVGYRNTTYFSKIFKKVTGVSPEEYRS